MEIKKEIQEQLQKIISELTKEKVEIKVDVPENADNGDYATNVALQLAKPLKKSPREIAEHIVNALTIEKNDFLLKVEVAGPGFINFWVNSQTLIKNANEILEKKDLYGFSDKNADRKIMVEFTDPNPFKEFHIGHLYSNTVGESISRLLESQGADVARACYQGDVGLHVAKAIWGMKQLHSEMPEEKEDLAVQAKFMGRAYATGAKAYEADAQAKQEIVELNKIIYARDNTEINNLYQLGRTWSLDYFESLYARLGTRFAQYYLESQVAPVGSALVQQHIGDVFEESDGAVIFPGKKFGLHNRVFINSHGLPTYEAKDLALPGLKYKDFPYDQSIIITANEQSDYFKVVLKALSILDAELAKKTTHISHGEVRLPSGKMSSRTGDVITGAWLIDTAKQEFKKAYPEMTDETVEKVAIAAVKYAFLKSGIGQDLTFSFEESIDLHGNSGPYLQYTAVRTQSVLEKAGDRHFEMHRIDPGRGPDDKFKLEPEEEALLRFLLHYPEVIADSAQKYAPSSLCTYLFELAQKFNLFYQKHSILADKNQSGRESESYVREFRLALTAAVGQVLTNGLYLLGIQVPEKM